MWVVRFTAMHATVPNRNLLLFQPSYFQVVEADVPEVSQGLDDGR